MVTKVQRGIIATSSGRLISLILWIGHDIMISNDQDKNKDTEEIGKEP